MANGDKSKKQEERTKRVGIRQGERTRRKEARLKAKTDRIKARHPQNERMEEQVGQALNLQSLMENIHQKPGRSEVLVSKMKKQKESDILKKATKY
jgi:hypothetical protein